MPEYIIKDKIKKLTNIQKIDILLKVAKHLEKMHNIDFIYGYKISPETILYNEKTENIIYTYIPLKKYLKEVGTMDSRCIQNYNSLNYVAPEMFTINFKSTKQVDIWILGCIMWELWHEKCLNLNGTSPKYYKELTINKKIPVNIEDNCLIKNIIEGCWIYNPNERINIDRVIESLEKINNTMNTNR